MGAFMPRRGPAFIGLAGFIALGLPARAEEIQILRDVEYGRAGETRLLLDLHLPARAAGDVSPVIVWVHGGAWRSGSKADMPLGGLVAKGYAVASVDYRLSTV